MIGQRVKAARLERGMTQRELGDAIGVVQSVISDIENGKLQSWSLHRHALRRVLEKTLAYFEPDEIDVSLDADVVIISEYESEGLDFYNGVKRSGKRWPYPRNLVVDQLGLQSSQVVLWRMACDSMSPMMTVGDMILIDLNDTNLSVSGIFILEDQGSWICKRVERVPNSTPRRIHLRTDNPSYGDYEVPETALRVVGRARWVGRSL